MAGSDTQRRLAEYQKQRTALSRGLFAPTNRLNELVSQANVAVRSAANVVSFGIADNLEAAYDALTQKGSGTLGQRYAANLASQHADDRYDAVHRPVANALGQVGGTVLGLAATGPGRVVAAAPRIVGAAPITAREIAAMLGAGAGGGVVVQHYSDVLGNRNPTWQNSLGAAAGGTAAVAALPFGPARAGAVDGAVTSAAQDLLNGRPVSLGDAGQAALLGGVLGRVGSAAGRATDGLSMKAKGHLGEALGSIRSTVNGMRRDFVPKSRVAIAGTSKYWYPDGSSGPLDLFEDKFGYDASPSSNQLLAMDAPGARVHLYHSTPDDVGNIVSIPAASIGPQVNKRRR
jgi:hypothetical protein